MSRTTLRDAVQRTFDRAFLQTEDPTALGLMRILVVGVMTLSMLTHLGSVAEYFSDEAWLAGDAARKAFYSRWSLFFYVTDPWAVRAVFGAGVLAHVLWVVGLWTPVVSVIAWLVWISMVGRNPLLYSLPDQLHGALALVLVLMPTGRGLSLDARRSGSKPVPVWCRRIVQLQIAVVYVATGLLKTGSTWRGEGTALYYALANPYNRHFTISGVLAQLQPWVLRPMTWLVLAWEVGFGGFVVAQWLRSVFGRPRRWPDLRWGFLGFGVAMHLGIQAMLYVAWFTPLMIATYASFLRPQEARWLVSRVLRQPDRGAEPTAEPDRGLEPTPQGPADSARAQL